MKNHPSSLNYINLALSDVFSTADSRLSIKLQIVQPVFAMPHTEGKIDITLSKQILSMHIWIFMIYLYTGLRVVVMLEDGSHVVCMDIALLVISDGERSMILYTPDVSHSNTLTGEGHYTEVADCSVLQEMRTGAYATIV